MTLCKRFIIEGKVQGVFYRAYAQQEAEKLQLTGWAKNLSDGNVEILACGSEEALNQFQILLWKGPPFARIDDVKSVEAAFQTFTHFSIVYSSK